MKKRKKNKLTKRRKPISNNKTKVKTTSVNKNPIMPEEFEEDRSMNIRMKPQAYQK